MWTRSSLQSYARTPIVGAGALLLLIFASSALSAHSLLAFFSVEGLLIVGGGVITVAFMSFEKEEVRKALNAIIRMFKEPRKAEEDLHRDMMAIIYCARLLKEKGMRSLESILARSGLNDPFIRYGFNMAVSEYPSDDVRIMMETAADATYEREYVPVDILHAMAGHAPAFGMVGTLVGMVAMLCTLDGDLKDIGSTLAVSFLSTLYGVLSARMIYIPAAAKLRQDVDNRRFRNYLITEGIVLLVSGKSPMYIQDRLNCFLKPEAHNYLNVLAVKTGEKKALSKENPAC